MFQHAAIMNAKSKPLRLGRVNGGVRHLRGFCMGKRISCRKKIRKSQVHKKLSIIYNHIITFSCLGNDRRTATQVSWKHVRKFWKIEQNGQEHHIVCFCHKNLGKNRLQNEKLMAPPRGLARCDEQSWLREKRWRRWMEKVSNSLDLGVAGVHSREVSKTLPPGNQKKRKGQGKAKTNPT